MGVSEFALPDLGEGLEEAEIVEWHVAPGDHVVADQPLVSVETGKAVVEIPAPWSGTVAELKVQPGDTVAVGAPLVAFDLGARKDQGAVVGRLDSGETGAPPVAAPPGGDTPPRGAAPRAMPAARAFAQRHAIDLSDISGTGPGGVITRADVERHAAGAAGPGWTPLEGPRRAMARNMAAAGAQVVPATIHDWADVTGWAGPGADIMARLVRAMVAAARAEPALNAWLDPQARARRLHEKVDLAIAVDAEAGLYVPVLRDAAARDAAATRAELDRLVARARARELTTEDQAGATISLSNFGPLGGTHGQLVVSPPQVAILGAGRISPRVAWGTDGPSRGQGLPLSLTFDHRAATGGEAARFLNAVIEDLQRKD
ncbi:dihydrolipoamide acetyltransferase family protein [Actibacterium sp. MT2.3-13A]|uniref:dihydrolipoamide acetyltransferase family protein n=1 Tax=Actibacterium sp. MT2.3-13A TaxID=2828332 RepID=UPI0020126564|nr:dihydrolipoamide acetyltransferase family protein [Actibacterium sp. MT2.3-13A]